MDSRQKGWFLTTVALGVLATALYAWLDARTPGGLTGNTVAGMWYGIVGSLLMIYAGLLSALRRVPSWWWIGTRKTWLKGHIWLGLLSELLILLHSGFHWGGPLEQVLWVVLTLTIATGVAGVVLQQFLPALITSRVAVEVPAEQLPHVCSQLRRRADAIVDALCGTDESAVDVDSDELRDDSPRARLRRFYEARLRPYLGHPYGRAARRINLRTLQDELAVLGTMSWSADVQTPLSDLGRLCEERRQLGEQEHLHRLLHAWILIHVPLSVMLLVMGTAHAALALYY